MATTVGIWADNCGAVYNHQLANENAVHMLEHGGVWITYNPKTATASDIATLKADVQGVDLSCTDPVSGPQDAGLAPGLGLSTVRPEGQRSARRAFIGALRHNKDTTPELGVACSDPYWSAKAASDEPAGPPVQRRISRARRLR